MKLVIRVSGKKVMHVCRKSDARFFEKVMHFFRKFDTFGKVVPIPKNDALSFACATKNDSLFCLSQLLRLGFLFLLYPTTPHMSGDAADDSTPTNTMLAFVGPGG